MLGFESGRMILQKAPTRSSAVNPGRLLKLHGQPLKVVLNDNHVEGIDAPGSHRAQKVFLRPRESTTIYMGDHARREKHGNNDHVCEKYSSLKSTVWKEGMPGYTKETY